MSADETGIEPLTLEEVSQLTHDMGEAIMLVADHAVMSPGGDRAYFGSTNHLETLRELRQRYFEYWYLTPQ